MEYGKSFGVTTTSSVAVAGYELGFGWFILGGIVISIVAVVAIRLQFRRGKYLGQI